MARVLHGVCGIGRGHAHRQAPLLRRLAADGHRLAVFAYGESLDLCRRWLQDFPNTALFEVAVPYLPGGPDGLDWAAAAAGASPFNPRITNSRAIAGARAHLGGPPDLVVSDYEPTAAQVAYSTGAPLVTFDQQSKYLLADPVGFGLPAGYRGAQDEIERLRLFFPKAALRLACSFFPVVQMTHPLEGVVVVPPLLRHEILTLKRAPAPTPEILVYLSPQQMGGHNLDGILPLLRAHPGVRFSLFTENPTRVLPAHVAVLPRTDDVFFPALARAHGVICTAGHSLLSELAHLGVPALPLALPLHEQWVNAAMFVRASGAPLVERLDAATLKLFLDTLDSQTAALGRPHGLLRGIGPDVVLQHLSPYLPAAASACK